MDILEAKKLILFERQKKLKRRDSMNFEERKEMYARKLSFQAKQLD